MPTIDLTADELAALTAALRRLIEDDKFPRAPRHDPLRSALAKLKPAAAPKPGRSPKTPPPAKADKRARHSAKVTTPKISPGFKLGRLPPKS